MAVGAALIAAAAIACGGDSAPSGEDGAGASDAATGDTGALDSGASDTGGGTDTATADAAPGTDATGDADASTSRDAESDAVSPGDAGAPDSGSGDAGADDTGAADAGPTDAGGTGGCESGGRMDCEAPCVFSFTSLDEDREGLRVVTVVARGGGPVSITGMAFEDTSPLVGFSSGWRRYADRITDGAWTFDGEGQVLDTGGQPLELPEGALELELRFEAPDNDPSAGCPSGSRDRCGELVVAWEACDGATGDPVRIPIRR